MFDKTACCRCCRKANRVFPNPLPLRSRSPKGGGRPWVALACRVVWQVGLAPQKKERIHRGKKWPCRFVYRKSLLLIKERNKAPLSPSFHGKASRAPEIAGACRAKALVHAAGCGRAVQKWCRSVWHACLLVATVGICTVILRMVNVAGANRNPYIFAVPPAPFMHSRSFCCPCWPMHCCPPGPLLLAPLPCRAMTAWKKKLPAAAMPTL